MKNDSTNLYHPRKSGGVQNPGDGTYMYTTFCDLYLAGKRLCLEYMIIRTFQVTYLCRFYICGLLLLLLELNNF